MTPGQSFRLRRPKRLPDPLSFPSVRNGVLNPGVWPTYLSCTPPPIRLTLYGCSVGWYKYPFALSLIVRHDNLDITTFTIRLRFRIFESNDSVRVNRKLRWKEALVERYGRGTRFRSTRKRRRDRLPVTHTRGPFHKWVVDETYWDTVFVPCPWLLLYLLSTQYPTRVFFPFIRLSLLPVKRVLLHMWSINWCWTRYFKS